MNEQIKEYLGKYPREVAEMFGELRALIYAAAPRKPSEQLWARLPSYYVGEAFVRLIPFKDHINIEASAAAQHTEELSGYKFTPKGMVQVFVGQEIPRGALERVFSETLGK
ncbi:MAG: DUF1801 domain-containing protein [Oscillospiraceae bacterium]